MEYAKTIFMNQLEDHADYIIAFAEEKGIDITGELQELKELTAQAKEERKRQKLLDDAQEIATQQTDILEQYKKNLLEGHSPDDPKMMQAMVDLEKLTTSLTVTKEQNCFATSSGYIDECLNYDPTKEFAPTLLGGIPFPEGTVSYIGARTSRGKTAAMINLAREALTHQTNPKKVIFVTLEMSNSSLITRLIHSVNYASHQGEGHQCVLMRIEEEEKKRRRDAQKSLLNELYHHVLEGTESSHPFFHPFKECAEDAKNQVLEALDQELITFYDARPHDFQTIISNIKCRASAGDIVLLDYIQRMPTVDQRAESYMRVKRISEGICQLAASTNSIVIAGAQFNRESTGSEEQDDSLGENNFRESGDLEQDAHNAIGIGWTSNKSGNKRFYKALKTRGSGHVGESYYFDWNGTYCHMAGTNDKYIPTVRKSDSVNNNQSAGDRSIIATGNIKKL
jgi:KaiC/GvpD/RAD55 family RecA-like ATPase